MKNLYEIIQSHLDKYSEMLYTISPGRVTAINLNEEGTSIVSVNVRPQVKNRYKDNLILDRSEIFSVPIVYPSGGGGILTFPIQVGDPVLLLFSREDISEWLDSGKEAEPATFRKFSLTDAIAVPCLYPDPEALDIDPENVVLTFSDSSFKITPAGNIEIASAGDSLLTVSGSLKVDVQGTADISSSGPTNISGETVNITGSGGITIGNGTVDLLTKLSETLNEIANATVTVDGNQVPLTNKTDITDLIAELDQLQP